MDDHVTDMPGAAPPALSPQPGPQVPVADIARLLEAGFQRTVSDAIADSHVAGQPVAVLDDDGTVVWLFPDGSRRSTRA